MNACSKLYSFSTFERTCSENSAAGVERAGRLSTFQSTGYHRLKAKHLVAGCTTDNMPPAGIMYLQEALGMNGKVNFG